MPGVMGCKRAREVRPATSRDVGDATGRVIPCYFRISSTRFWVSARIGAMGWDVVTIVWIPFTIARLTSMMFFTGNSACAYWSWSRAVIAWGYLPTYSFMSGVSQDDFRGATYPESIDQRASISGEVIHFTNSQAAFRRSGGVALKR